MDVTFQSIEQVLIQPCEGGVIMLAQDDEEIGSERVSSLPSVTQQVEAELGLELGLSVFRYLLCASQTSHLRAGGKEVRLLLLRPNQELVTNESPPSRQLLGVGGNELVLGPPHWSVGAPTPALPPGD